MKKIFLIIALLIFSIPLTEAYGSENISYKETNVLGVEKSDKAKIKSLLINLNKYSNKHDINSIKTFYSKDYISYDGFKYNAFFNAIKETFETYPDITYTSNIKQINVFGDWATAEMVDKTTSKRQAVTQAIVNNKPTLDKTLDGIMESTCHYVVYLKKISGKWVIYSDNIIAEETAIKYGKANDINIDINSPLIVNEGDEYCISLNVSNKPKDAIMLASLTREEIKYPPAIPNDIFKKVPSTGTLERIVSANKKGINEYSMASVGITEISLNEEKTAINYKMSGIAFLMKRVNVYNNKNITNKETL